MGEMCLRVLQLILLICFVTIYVLYEINSHRLNLDFNFDAVEKIDWHDYQFMAYEATRVGPGENGAPVYLKPNEVIKNKKLYKLEGVYTLANNKISPNRSLPDYRPKV